MRSGSSCDVPRVQLVVVVVVVSNDLPFDSCNPCFLVSSLGDVIGGNLMANQDWSALKYIAAINTGVGKIANGFVRVA